MPVEDLTRASLLLRAPQIRRALQFNAARFAAAARRAPARLRLDTADRETWNPASGIMQLCYAAGRRPALQTAVRPAQTAARLA